ncbi:hypothetical protein LAN17_24840, partial [Mycobacterium tuberculosis]|nr:hypothetical protein [Mycobacterium tuberculosis]
ATATETVVSGGSKVLKWLSNFNMALAAAVEQGSSHPLAQAIVREAQRRQLSIPLASGQRALAGSITQGGDVLVTVARGS